LAIRKDVYESFICLPHVTEFLQAEQVNLLVFDPQTSEVVQWIKWNNIATSSNGS
jgi:hypothetical protein